MFPGHNVLAGSEGGVNKELGGGSTLECAVWLMGLKYFASG